MSYSADGGASCGSCAKHFDYARLYARLTYTTESVFEIECDCGWILEIEAVPVPEFKLIKTREPAPRRGSE